MTGRYAEVAAEPGALGHLSHKAMQAADLLQGRMLQDIVMVGENRFQVQFEARVTATAYDRERFAIAFASAA